MKRGSSPIAKGGAALAKLIRDHFSGQLDKPLDELTAWDLNVWKTACRKRGNTEATVVRNITLLKGVCAVAIEQAEPLSVNPVAQVMTKTNARSEEVVRYLDAGERVRLYAALRARGQTARDARPLQRASPHAQLKAVSVATQRGVHLLSAANRVSFAQHRNAARLTARAPVVGRESRRPAPMITVPRANAKGDKARRIPLNREAPETLEAWKPLAHAFYVFGNLDTGLPLGDIKKPWEDVLTRAGIESFRWHDLRHDFASRLVMAGVDLNRVRDLLGHADLKMTLRYAHLAPEHLADAVSVLKPPPSISQRRQTETMMLAA